MVLFLKKWLRSGSWRNGGKKDHRKSSCYGGCVMWMEGRSSGKMFQEVRREAVETSLDIKDVIYQASCFLKTIIHRTMPIDWHRTDTEYTFLQLETKQNMYYPSCQLDAKSREQFHSQIPVVIIKFTIHLEMWGAGTARQFQLRSSFITAAMYWSVIPDDIRCLTLIRLFGLRATE